MIRQRFVFGERKSFLYHNPSPCNIVYYIGQVITIVTEEPLYEYGEDVTFVCFDDCESATRVVRRSYRVSMNHDWVLPARGYTYDAGLDKHLVCFDRFDGFLPQADPTFLASLEDPNSSRYVPGFPNDIVQCEIIKLTEALKYMFSKGVSSSLLHLPIGYVWSPGSSWSPGKLKIILLEFDDEEDHTSVEWNKIKARDVERFGTGLNKYFLHTTVGPGKDSFLRCFWIRLEDENRRLPMIRYHPFLMNSIWDILSIFSKVHRALRNHRQLEDVNLTKLMVALNSKQFKSEFMPNGEWTRQEMSREFNAFLRGDRRGGSIMYNTRDMGDLVRYLRNMFEKGSMSLSFILSEVGRLWPHLLGRFHEKLSR